MITSSDDKYHVIMQINPEDCMGHRIKDIPFKSEEEAHALLNSYLNEIDSIRHDIADLYSYPEWCNACSDSSLDDTDSLMGSVEISILRCDTDLVSLIKQAEKEGADMRMSGFEYNVWQNDFDDIGYIDDLCSILEVYQKFNADFLYRVTFDFFIEPKNTEISNLKIEDKIA